MEITEREKHIENLKTLVAFLEVNPIFKLSDEMYKSLDYAISSIKTDLKYDLLYEGEDVYTKADMMAMFTELKKEIDDEAWNRVWSDARVWLDERIVEMESVSKIIQEKINALKGVEDGDNN